MKLTTAYPAAPTYTASFDSNSGGGSVAKTVSPITALQVFNNWNINTNGTGTSYTSGSTYNSPDNATLYAQWSSSVITLPSPRTEPFSDSQVKYCDLTVDFNGGEQSNFRNAKLATFKGWFTSPSGGTKRGNGGDKYSLTGNETLYAQWNDPTFADWLNYLPELSNPKRFGYAFDGWYTARSGGSKVTSSTAITGDTTIYAQWTIGLDYTVVLVIDGDAGMSDLQTIEVKSESSINLPTPTMNWRIFYDPDGGNVSPSYEDVSRSFIGWYTSYSGGTKVNNPFTPTKSYTDIFARYNNPTAGALPTPTKSGYTFLGWFTGLTKETANTKVTENTEVTWNTTFYAKWAKN